jgi:thiamine kinase-like enzyme
MHGDLSGTNILIAGPGRVRLIDFEAAGAGDPSWDLVCAEAVIAMLDPHSVAALHAAYRDDGGPGRPTSALRLIRGVMTCWQKAAYESRLA